MSYFFERLPSPVFVPLAIAIALPAHVGRVWDGAELALDAAFALLLLAQFRLWDDLADRRADAIAHPNRVLSRAASAAPYAAICLALGAANACVAIARNGTEIALPLLAALAVMLGVVYGRLRSRSLPGELARLAKYPAFVLIVAAGRPDGWHPAQFGAVAAYAAACAYEAWHDPATPLRFLPRSAR